MQELWNNELELVSMDKPENPSAPQVRKRRDWKR
jgi:hypothetical protein